MVSTAAIQGSLHPVRLRPHGTVSGERKLLKYIGRPTRSLQLYWRTWRDRPFLPQFPVSTLRYGTAPMRTSSQLVRSYSISGASELGTYRISVKRGAGPGSRHLVDATQAGDKIEISAPRGEFTLRPGGRPVVLLSAGIGVTPVLSMLHALASARAESLREVWWIHAARNAREHVFAQEAGRLLAGYSSESFGNRIQQTRPN